MNLLYSSLMNSGIGVSVSQGTIGEDSEGEGEGEMLRSGRIKSLMAKTSDLKSKSVSC
jgi:hypothetical protein